MDQRHEQIREGAGLEESRINTEFVDLIKKWSSPVLFVAAAISLGYLGLMKLEDRRVARVDEAFAELELQRNSASPSPDSLLRVAGDYSDIRAVAPLASAHRMSHRVHGGATNVRPSPHPPLAAGLAKFDVLLVWI